MKRKIEGTDYFSLKFDEMTDFLFEIAKEGPLTLLVHVHPDGDCIGSAFALKSLLKLIGCESRVVCPDPMPERLAFLDSFGQSDISVPAPGEPFGPGSRAVALDIAAPSLLPDLYDKYNVLLTIDHHANSTPFSDRYLDKEASATGEIVWRIARSWQRTKIIDHIPADVAYCSYAAISSDTGCFRYSNVTPSTHRIAAQLVTLVPGHADIDRRLFEIRTPSRIAAEKAAFEKLKLIRNGKISVCAMSATEIEKSGIRKEELDALIDVARSVDGIMMAMSVREEGARDFRVSLRSSSGIDAAEICTLFGGGGHIKAAGCLVHADSLDEAVGIVADEIEKRIAV